MAYDVFDKIKEMNELFPLSIQNMSAVFNKIALAHF